MERPGFIKKKGKLFILNLFKNHYKVCHLFMLNRSGISATCSSTLLSVDKNSQDTKLQLLFIWSEKLDCLPNIFKWMIPRKIVSPSSFGSTFIL